jgi:transcriptional regulator with XRE-family HTH domain
MEGSIFMKKQDKRPNEKLKRERELRGWSQRKIAERVGTAEQVVARWEGGLHKPNRYFQTQLCELFGKNAEELGFLGPDTKNHSDSISAQRREKREPTFHRTVDTSKILPSKFSRIDEETLAQFGALTETCMNLSEGNQLELAERILWSYLPGVEAIAQQSSEHQKRAASISSQGYLIAASLVGHHNDLQARQRFSEQALLYGDLAQDHTLQVAALRQLAATFSYLKLPQQVMQTYQRALPSVENVPPLLRSCIYAALSGVFAQFQQKQDAYHFIGLAYESFGEHQGDEPYFLRAINASQNLLIHWDGKNHLLLGEPDKAEHVFMQLDVLDPTMKLPKRIRVEAINNRARMFIAVGNMEQACMYLEVAMKTAIEIGSRLRLQEVATTFQSLKSTWPSEKKVQELGDLFLQHLVNSVQ